MNIIANLAIELQAVEQPISTEIKMADGVFIKTMVIAKAGTVIPQGVLLSMDNRTELFEGPFDVVFPQGNIRHHFVGQDQSKGVYAKELLIPAGFRLVSHDHPYDHLSVLAKGTGVIEVDGVKTTLTGPTALTIHAGKLHTLWAETDVVWFCIHPTDENDPTKVDQVILEKTW